MVLDNGLETGIKSFTHIMNHLTLCFPDWVDKAATNWKFLRIRL